jgi:hypothetical protein
MKHAEPARQAPSTRRSAASDHADEGRRARPGHALTLADGAAQLAQVAAIEQSPQAVAQRQQLHDVFGAGGAVAQLWRTVKDQDGEFEGDPAHHHLHRAGDEEHYKYGSNNNSRVNYMRQGGHINFEGVERAIASCEGSGGKHKEGRAECLAYLRDLLTRKPKAPEIKPTAPVRKDSAPVVTKRTGGGYSDANDAEDLFGDMGGSDHEPANDNKADVDDGFW